MNSPFGMSLIGIRENSARMHAVGTPVYRRLVTVYGVSAGIAGLAGGLFAESNAYVTLDALSFARSGTILIILILGGVGRLYGAFAGAVAISLCYEEVQKVFHIYYRRLL